MIGRAVRTVERTPAAEVARLGGAGVANVHEAMARTGLMIPEMQPAWSGARAAGNAVTALCPPGDNWMIHVAIELMQPGDVLVVATTALSSDGFFGDLLAEAARVRGAVGLVTDTGCRDVATLSEMGFPVWSRAVSAQGTVKETLGAVNIPIVCGGVAVHPGDTVVGDEDGVAVVPRARAADVADTAEARMAKEDAVRTRILAGESTLDIFGLRDRLVSAGFSWEP